MSTTTITSQNVLVLFPHMTLAPFTSLHIENILGTQGRTDISSVLVGNVLNAPHRRDCFLIGFILVGLLSIINNQS